MYSAGIAKFMFCAELSDLIMVLMPHTYPPRVRISGPRYGKSAQYFCRGLLESNAE